MEHQQKRKPRKLRNKKKSPLDTSKKDQCRTHPDQQESTTIMEETNHSGEPPINFDKPTWELRVAEKIRGARLNCHKEGTIEYHFIPTRSYWLSTVRDDWGTTDDEIKASIAYHQMQFFGIEVCGWHMGYGVILRDEMRSPIIVISKAVEEYVSPFYHELQGVSLGLKLALKYKVFDFEFNCISQKVAGYVMRSWGLMEDCGCPPRDDPNNPREKKNYCVQCSMSMLDLIGEGNNADKILPLLDEIFYDALELERQGDPPCFHLSTTKLFRAQAVWHLANLGIDMELRLDEIDEDDELAEILYKDVYGHGTVQELMLLHKFKKQQWEAKEQLYFDRAMAAEKAGQFSEH
ncbi:hypothetical protein MKX03_009949 [Papaver bracteatum]|nr:hypothetical protein MKX03_009949 [Papaver bracteatum]